MAPKCSLCLHVVCIACCSLRSCKGRCSVCTFSGPYSIFHKLDNMLSIIALMFLRAMVRVLLLTLSACTGSSQQMAQPHGNSLPDPWIMCTCTAAAHFWPCMVHRRTLTGGCVVPHCVLVHSSMFCHPHSAGHARPTVARAHAQPCRAEAVKQAKRGCNVNPV